MKKLILCIAVAMLAIEQVHADPLPANYTFFPTIGSVAGDASSAANLVNAFYQPGTPSIIGQSIVDGTDISVDETHSDNGDGTCLLSITMTAENGELWPGGLAVSGQPALSGGLFFGANSGAAGVDLAFDLPSIVSSATVELFDSAGTSTGAPIDISTLPDFTAGPGGSWDGSLGIIFNSITGLGTGSVDLTVVYSDATHAVPEPASTALLGWVLAAVAIRRRRA